MKKTKLRSSLPMWVASFLFVASWVVFGVAFALKTVNVGLNGQVTFTATGVYAKVTGSVSGTKTTNTLNDITIDASTTEDNQSWDNVAFDFIDEDTAIVTTITVENLSTERSLYVTFEENINVNNITISRTLDSTPVTSTFSTTTIPHSSSSTFVITMKVDDKNKSVSGKFDFNINLSSEEVKQASDYQTLSFTYNEANGTATVAQNESNLPTGDLVIPAQVIYNNRLYEVTKIDSQAFRGCTGLTSVVIPESVTSIGILSFYECEELTSVTMPSKITSIEAETFSHCTKLTNISIPENVISIGSSSFSTCTSLTSITIPSKVTDIGNYAFLDCSSLTSLTIPSSVTSIGLSVFTRDYGLTSITVESGNTVYHSAGNCLIETASKKLLQGCNSSVIPNDGSVTSIANNAFYKCTGLTNITIPSSVTSIGNDAFEFCSNLASVTISDGVISIGQEAFYECTSLVSINIPSSVESIGASAFQKCSSLTSITIPANVTSLETNTFSSCTSLKTIFIDSNAISSAITSYYGNGDLLIYAKTIYIKEGCTAGSYITESFTQTTSDQSGYVKWVKN